MDQAQVEFPLAPVYERNGIEFERLRRASFIRREMPTTPRPTSRSVLPPTVPPPPWKRSATTS
jgi:hypothetical protein